MTDFFFYSNEIQRYVAAQPIITIEERKENIIKSPLYDTLFDECLFVFDAYIIEQMFRKSRTKFRFFAKEMQTFFRLNII